LAEVSEPASRTAHEQRLIERYQALLDVADVLSTHRDTTELFRSLEETLRPVVSFDFIAVVLHEEDTGLLRLALFESRIPSPVSVGTTVPAEHVPQGWVFQNQQPLTFRVNDGTSYPRHRALMRHTGVQIDYHLPLSTSLSRLGVLIFGSTSDQVLDEQELAFMQRVAHLVAVAIENARNFEQARALQEKLTQEKLYLEEEIRGEYGFDEIVGESASLRNVLQQISTVAESDATVLILGETGTGKELVARALHDSSPRKAHTFVKLNCAAIPTGLLESELFGHEKGAFTGAIAQKLGRLELADGGTLFLDEIGDIPLELQPKLLRAIQEREFERLGGARTQKVNVRFIAATNCDLAKMVADRQFRSDLYYRLNVFPIAVPPLRERPEDIPRLVRYFASKHASRLNRKIETIPADAMKALERWHWPGNVRELENLIERSAILSRGTVLQVPMSELRGSAGPAAGPTLEETERAHIVRVLRETRGQLAGVNGAAKRLGLKRTTLQSKMKRLGIPRDGY
jgi:formate hydrogenlyase transcriptional activator